MEQYIPVLQVLDDVNKLTNFVDCFRHYTIKHNREKPESGIFYAGAIGLGCNIGIRKIANVSVGVNENTLVNTCNWYFSVDNLNDANNQIIKYINKLTLPYVYIKQLNSLHSAADGQKYAINADSLNSNYSFKYFGNGKGSTVYSFIDERGVLFHSTVISASEREASYVIDGIHGNEEVKTDVISTDTHGFTEIVFGATHLMGISFAPRIKKPQEQSLYSFAPINSYVKKGYKVLPSR